MNRSQQKPTWRQGILLAGVGLVLALVVLFAWLGLLELDILPPAWIGIAVLPGYELFWPGGIHSSHPIGGFVVGTSVNAALYAVLVWGCAHALKHARTSVSLRERDG